MKNSKRKKYKASKKTWIILTVFAVILVGIIASVVVYTNSESYNKKQVENKMKAWAEEYYTEKLSKVASGYIKTKVERGESITINIDALKNYGKDTSELKNSKTGKQCNDIDTYVVIKVDSNAEDISKDYTVESVVLDCFD